MNSKYILSTLVLGDKILTSATPLYINGETVRKAYLGNLLVYSTIRTKKVKE